jgi:hypothetical protein
MNEGGKNQTKALHDENYATKTLVWARANLFFSKF